MKVYHIVFLMLSTLAILFLFAPKFRRREMKKNEAERRYFDLLKNYAKDKNENDLATLKTLATQRYNIDDEQDIVHALDNDMKMLGVL